jgi:hypothetical protein
MTASVVPPQVSRVFQPVLSHEIHCPIPPVFARDPRADLGRVVAPKLSSDPSDIRRTSDGDFGKEHRPSRSEDRAVLDVIKALAALDPAGYGLDDACAQLESSTYVMADEARPHFRVDQMNQQSYCEDLIDAIAHPSAVRQTRSAVANALRAKLSAPSTTID